MSTQLEALDRELRAAGLWRGDAERGVAQALATPPDAAAGSRWVLALQIGGAWFSALFLLLFLGIGVDALVKSATGWLCLGTLLTASCGAVLGRLRGPVVRQFLLVASLAGHGALLIGVVDLGREAQGGAYLGLALYELGLLYWVGWRTHRLIAALMACAALSGALYAWHADWAVHWLVVLFWALAVALWLEEARWQACRTGGAIEALARAFAWLALVDAFFGFSWRTVAGSWALNATWPRACLCALSIAGMLWLLRGALRSPWLLAGVALLGGALGVAWQAPAIAMGALLLAVGFARGRPALAGLGGVVCVLALGRYYYDLQATLLVKSGWMVLGGALLLAARALLRQGWQKMKEAAA